MSGSERVQLDGEGRPVAIGRQIDGEDIPRPPERHPPDEYRWDGSSWVHDPPGEEKRREALPSHRRRLVAALEAGQITERDALRVLLLRRVPDDVTLPDDRSSGQGSGNGPP